MANSQPGKNNESEKPVLESLQFLDGRDSQLTTPSLQSHDSSQYCPCILCDQEFEVPSAFDEMLRHFAVQHKFVIADVNLISDLRKYIVYWKQRFKEEALTAFCSVISTNNGPNDIGKQEDYYLLSNVLEEDKSLREYLQKKKLEVVLAQQQTERDDMSFCRGCLFCREQFSGKRALLFDHLSTSHSFNVGHPDNLVYTDELLDKLQQNLDSLLCLYCEKTFKDRTVLKEHMRKKQHKRINPKNRTYDKYYIINYLEIGKNWEAIQSERDTKYDTDGSSDTEDEWEDLEEAGGQAVCLYCDFSSSNHVKLHNHMQELHDLDLHEIKLRLNLNFYQQVKLINYIRRQVHVGVCIGCDEQFQSKSELIDHMHEKGHTNEIPEKDMWDQPQYFFPTYENDNLLCQLDDDGDSDTADNHVTIIAEERPLVDTILSEDSVRQDILAS